MQNFIKGDRVKVVKSNVTALLGAVGTVVFTDVDEGEENSLVYVAFDNEHLNDSYSYESFWIEGVEIKARGLFFWRLEHICKKKRKSGFGSFIRKIEGLDNAPDI